MEKVSKQTCINAEMQTKEKTGNKSYKHRQKQDKTRLTDVDIKKKKR